MKHGVVLRGRVNSPIHTNDLAVRSASSYLSFASEYKLGMTFGSIRTGKSILGSCSRQEVRTMNFCLHECPVSPDCAGYLAIQSKIGPLSDQKLMLCQTNNPPTHSTFGRPESEISSRAKVERRLGARHL
jgi:hypothetical protein